MTANAADGAYNLPVLTTSPANCPYTMEFKAKSSSTSDEFKREKTINVFVLTLEKCPDVNVCVYRFVFKSPTSNGMATASVKAMVATYNPDYEYKNQKGEAITGATFTLNLGLNHEMCLSTATVPPTV